MPLIGSSRNYTTLNEYLAEYNYPVGVDGYGNYTLGPYAQDNSLGLGGAGSYGDNAFAPQFNFNSPVNYAANTMPAGYASTPEIRAAIDNGRNTGYYGPEWSDQMIAEDYWNNIGRYAPPPGAPVASPSNFGGAVQGSGFVTGGPVAAPVASGADSVAQSLGNGFLAGGDVFDALVNAAPILGPALLTGGDLDIAAPLIIGNHAPVSIVSADPSVARAAIEGAAASVREFRQFATSALDGVAEAAKSPDERTTSNALWAFLGLGALVLFAR